VIRTERTPGRVTVWQRNWLLPGLDWTAWNRCETNKSIHHTHIYIKKRNSKWIIANLYLKLHASRQVSGRKTKTRNVVHNKRKSKCDQNPMPHLIEWRYKKETDFQGWIELLEIAAKLTRVYTISIFTFKIETANEKYPICTSNCRRDLFDLTWIQRHKELAKLSTEQRFSTKYN